MENKHNTTISSGHFTEYPITESFKPAAVGGLLFPIIIMFCTTLFMAFLIMTVWYIRKRRQIQLRNHLIPMYTFDAAESNMCEQELLHPCSALMDYYIWSEEERTSLLHR